MSWSDKHQPAHAGHQQVKLFGRDPLLWVSLVAAAITTAGVFGIGLNAGVAGAINGAITAGIALWTTRPVTPGLLTGAVMAGVGLLAEFGVELAPEQTATINGLVVAVFAFLARGQVNPRETAVSRS